jgi:glycerol-3-phosphate dehydrogenase (NAD(P)+)
MTLGLLLVRKGHVVRMWEKNPERQDLLLSTRTVPDLPESVKIPSELSLYGDVARAVIDAEAIVLALPTQALRDSLALLARQARPELKTLLVSVMKGIEIGTRKRVSEVIREFLPRNPLAVLTGPGIPFDVARGDPTSLVVAATEPGKAQLVRDNFSTDNLRIYSSEDLTGLELGGALKNVMAIAAGIIDGMGLGLNAKSALLTRGLYEVSRLGIALNANPLTFAGLSGIGDLIVTAFSPLSRNHQFGMAIAQGRSVNETIAALSGVAEGYYTCKAAYELANRLNIELPITSELHRILYESEHPRDSIRRLLSRSLKSETWG